MGKKMFYLTNNSAKHRRVLKEKLDKLGFNAKLEECTNTAFLAGQYLLQENFDKNKLVYVLGQQGLVDELEDLGIKSLPIGVDPVPSDGTWSVDGVPVSEDDLDSRVAAVICGFDFAGEMVTVSKQVSVDSAEAKKFLKSRETEE